jgi:hypothetical protein
MDLLTIEDIILKSDANNDWKGVSKGMGTVKFNTEEVNIRIECAYDGDDIQNDNFKEAWANKHPNPHATGYYFNLYYCATLLKRIILVSVDGGNATLPLPDSNNKVKEFDYKIAEIFDVTNTLDSYMQRSGLTL